MSGLTRSLSDVPEEGMLTPSVMSPRSESLSPTTPGQPTMATPSATTTRPPSKSRTPSIRTLGRSSSESTVPMSATPTPNPKRVSSSSTLTTTSTASKSRKPTPGLSGPKIKTIPTLPHDKNAESVPSTAMHFSRAPVYGAVPQRGMRAHTMTLVDNIAWLVGGVDDKDANKDMKDMYCFDIETMQWTIRESTGTIPPPFRAHTTTLIDRKLVVIGGGFGIKYFNDVYVFDTTTRHWSTPVIVGPAPPPRRAHTAVLHGQKIWIFGGGTGLHALNDVWTLDVSSFTRMKWEQVQTSGRTPKNRGYHTANLVRNLMVVVGGSDGKDFFTDVWCLDLVERHWSQVTLLTNKYKRIAHSATQVGSFLLITGGFNGEEYCSEVLPFNLVSLTYEPRITYGNPPSGRGYHASILADSRLFLFGGFDGGFSFDDVYILDLAAGAYLPQVTSFSIDL
ncbi:hypothetical protein H0H92_009902 [Tricholoma furcatifolium]|nr:hypothetical protein H0H92_009902 [Tricholoma furcatifolium]